MIEDPETTRLRNMIEREVKMEIEPLKDKIKALEKTVKELERRPIVSYNGDKPAW